MSSLRTLTSGALCVAGCALAHATAGATLDAEVQPPADKPVSDPPIAVQVAAPVTRDATPAVLEAVTVTAARLKDAQVQLSPKVGTTVYTIDQQLIDDYGRGANTPMNDVLLQLPGIAQDSKASGSIHVRDDHGDVQFRINGVTLPEGISGFGQSVDSRFVDHIDYVTGAVPAQYGMRTAGIVDIQTKDGMASAPGGSVGVLAGSHNLIQPSVELLGSDDTLSYFVTGDYLANDQGIENPTASTNAIHDHTEQVHGFAYLSKLVNADTRVSMMLSTYDGKFEIPNNPGQPAAFSLAGVSNVATGFNAIPSQDLDQNQREQNQYVVGTLQQRSGALDYQASAFYQYSKLHYLPDPSGGDLVYTGVASDVTRSNSAAGAQMDASYQLGDGHTPRFGGSFTHQATQSDNSVQVFATSGGAPTTDVPQTIVDDSSKRGNLLGLYVQDEWRIDPRVTLNYGLRYDQVAAYTSERQWSPRVNALFTITDSTAVHAGYARYFTPPPQELVSQSSVGLYANTTNAPEVPYSDVVKAERTHYYDIGLVQKLTSNWTVSVDGYYKDITNLLDEGQFGQALILTPFNYAQGHAQGLEMSTTYTGAQWSGYFNAAIARAKGRNIVSGQSLFGADELAYIASHYIYLDHDQRYSLSGGVSYRMGDARLSADVLAGSGLRNTPDDAAPNSGKLPGYATMGVAAIRQWKTETFGTLEGRVGVGNLFDRTYLLRDGSGVGVGAPQFGGRRTWFASLSQRF